MFNALTVVFERDLAVDELDALISAIRLLRGVLDVVPHAVGGVGIDGLVAEQRVRTEIARKLWDVLK